MQLIYFNNKLSIEKANLSEDSTEIDSTGILLPYKTVNCNH